jgi:hypothetical protein
LGSYKGIDAVLLGVGGKGKKRECEREKRIKMNPRRSTKYSIFI